jgi:hypothetical protein
LRTRGTYFLFAACAAIIAALTLADYGDGDQDTLFLVLGSIGAIGFFVMGLRAGNPKAR